MRIKHALCRDKDIRFSYLFCFKLLIWGIIYDNLGAYNQLNCLAPEKKDSKC